MLNLSLGFLSLILFVGLVSFPAFWPLRFLRQGEPQSKGLVLGDSAQKNLSVTVQSFGDRDQVSARFLVFRNQKNVYHNISFVENREKGRTRRFLIATPQVTDRQDLTTDYRVYFYKDGRQVEDVVLNEGERSSLNVEVTTKDNGPSSYNVDLQFGVISF